MTGQTSPVYRVVEGAPCGKLGVPMLRALSVHLASGSMLDDHFPVPELELAGLLGQALSPRQELVGRHLVLGQRDHNVSVALARSGRTSSQCLVIPHSRALARAAVILTAFFSRSPLCASTQTTPFPAGLANALPAVVRFAFPRRTVILLAAFAA